MQALMGRQRLRVSSIQALLAETLTMHRILYVWMHNVWMHNVWMHTVWMVGNDVLQSPLLPCIKLLATFSSGISFVKAFTIIQTFSVTVQSLFTDEGGCVVTDTCALL